MHPEGARRAGLDPDAGGRAFEDPRALPEIDLAQAKVGVFGKLATPDTKLVDGDRVEIYRPLIADPKETRKRRAAEGKPMRKGRDVSA